MSKTNYLRNMIAIVICLAATTFSAQAQIGNVVRRAANAATGSSSGSTTAQPAVSPASSAAGATLYVCFTNGAGSRTANGSKETPYKDLQAAIDAAPSGSKLLISEGNYLGRMEQGYIEIKDKYLHLEGGWNAGFTERNYMKYRTMIQPGVEQIGTSGAYSMLNIFVKFGTQTANLNSQMIIDGIIFDGGEINPYWKPIPEDPRTGTPPGVETGQTVEPDASISIPLRQGSTSTRRGIHGEVQGIMIIRNCVFINCYNYGIQMQNDGGAWEIYNNLFVSCRMASCEVRGHGGIPEDKTSLKFYNNTVLFTWTRTKLMEDMGYGFRYMTRMNYDVYDNIFGCNYYGALDRTRFDSDLQRDKIRKTNAFNNLFFANTMGDICLPSGGGMWNFQFAKNFEEVEQLEKYEGNRELNQAEAQTFSAALSAPYFHGFMGLTVSSTSKFNENSVMNQWRSALGMNMRGTETVRVSMWGNRYPIADINKLWGVIPGKGAQIK